ncbi:Tn3 family transposase [Nonomuraea sp. NPDC000554]|uniref:Tn3 family transposase n=1 Tax=Nonomuraea sp. NPDC000554 TaxID=3154259 RepID=UPI003322060F
MIKYATAIKHGTASTEAILRRFTESASHPTYRAMLEVGRAQKTIFVARYLRPRNSSGGPRKGSTWWSPPREPTVSSSTARAATSPPAA